MSVYRKHLALFVSGCIMDVILNWNTNAKEQANHIQFEKWVEWYYKSDISDEEWKAIIEEDHNSV